MKKFNVLLINLTNKKEPNEVEFLSEFFHMIQMRYPNRVDFKPIQVRSKKEFKSLLSDQWADIIHIAAHGYSKKHSGRRGKETSIYLSRTSINSDEINKLPEIKTKLVFVSACLNSYEDMANAFLNRGVEKFIAPKTIVDWVNAALFSVMFYKKYVWDGRSFKTAFMYAKRATKLGKDFPEYWYK
jgi:CHAT domain-containing protein